MTPRMTRHVTTADTGKVSTPTKGHARTMGSEPNLSKRPRSRRYVVALLVVGGSGLMVGLVAGRESRLTVEPVVRDLETVGYECDPMKTTSDGILSSYSVCEKGEVRLEMSSQPSDQAHDEFVRFTIEEAGCPLADSRGHDGFTLHVRDRIVVYEFGRQRQSFELDNSFASRDVVCAKKTV